MILFPIAITFYITWGFIHFVDGFFSPIYAHLGIDIFGMLFRYCDSQTLFCIYPFPIVIMKAYRAVYAISKPYKFLQGCKVFKKVYWRRENMLLNVSFSHFSWDFGICNFWCSLHICDSCQYLGYNITAAQWSCLIDIARLNCIWFSVWVTWNPLNGYFSEGKGCCGRIHSDEIECQDLYFWVWTLSQVNSKKTELSKHA